MTTPTLPDRLLAAKFRKRPLPDGGYDVVPQGATTPQPGDGVVVLSSNGYPILVSHEDFAQVSAHSWVAIKKGSVWYACRNVYAGGGRKERRAARTYMHRQLLGDPAGQIDHLNGNGLDNRRDNLRVVSHEQNQRNRAGAQVNSKSGVRGVYWHKQRSKWAASIRVAGKAIHLGIYDTVEAAQKARREAEERYWSAEDRAIAAALTREQREGVTDEMVARFLGWKLPADFAPDCGITFEPVGNKGTRFEYRFEPVGTNLLTAVQAREMLEYVLATGAPTAQQPLDGPANNAGVATGSRNGPPSESVTRGNLPPSIPQQEAPGAVAPYGWVHEASAHVHWRADDPLVVSGKCRAVYTTPPAPVPAEAQGAVAWKDRARDMLNRLNTMQPPNVVLQQVTMLGEARSIIEAALASTQPAPVDVRRLLLDLDDGIEDMELNGMHDAPGYRKIKAAYKALERALLDGQQAGVDHVASRDCWCEPTQDTEEPSVYIHRSKDDGH